ncbi:unconventional prefoldin RPB5 interactor [Ischnura elegans]|uniref:unconventional prefoldin RPB5 interactor n=1 Tax=Ischnura elegans TaxID=197161 RepID=UPI001ED8937E|nr:unconventional prefoldin RPB5 interactor [Ischnura elegans]
MDAKTSSDSDVKNSLNPLSAFDVFNKQYERSLDANREKHDTCEKHRAELSSVRSHLETLPKELSYDVMIPIGSQGLMRGKMVHTNEILALVGDNWYVKTSAMHAAEICQRRIERCDALLNECVKERELIKTWRETTNEVLQPPEENTREIYEEYDEAKEREWREKHRENVRKHYVELSKLRNKENWTELDDEEALNRRLDELEKKEEMEDELIRSGGDIDDDDDDDDDDTSSSDDDPSLVTAEIATEGSSKDSHPPSSESQGKRRVSFSKVVKEVDLEVEEEEKPSPLRIFFEHSDSGDKSALKNRSESASKSPGELASPSDVYTHYASLFSSNPTPKGILKQSSRSPSIEENIANISLNMNEEEVKGMTFNKWESSETESSQHKTMAFGDVIVEHTVDAELPEPNSNPQVTRPVSRFKAMRQKQKNN